MESRELMFWNDAMVEAALPFLSYYLGAPYGSPLEHLLWCCSVMYSFQFDLNVSFTNYSNYNSFFLSLFFLLHSGSCRSYRERPDGCTANQERKGKETIVFVGVQLEFFWTDLL